MSEMADGSSSEESVQSQARGLAVHRLKENIVVLEETPPELVTVV